MQPVRLLTTILTLVLSFSLFSQGRGFVNGSIEFEDGDEVLGLLFTDGSFTTPQTFRFKSSETEAERDFDVRKIRAVNIGDRRFEKSQIEIEESLLNPRNLTYETELQLQAIIAFTEVIVAGEKSLHVYRPTSDQELFYISSEGNVEFLKYRKYLKRKPEGSINEYSSDPTVLNLQFRNQLAYHLSGLENLEKRLRNLDYNRSDLARIFINYYEQTTNKEYVQKDDKKGLNLVTSIGAVATKLTYQGEGFLGGGINEFKSSYLDFENHLSPYLMVTIEKNMKYSISSLNLDFSYFMNKGYAKTFFGTSFNNATYTANIQYHQFNLAPSASIKPFLKLPITLILGAGARFLAVSEINDLTGDLYIYGSDRQVQSDLVPDNSLKQIGVYWNAGLQLGLKRFVIYYSATMSQGIDQRIDYKNRILSQGLLLGYKLELGN